MTVYTLSKTMQNVVLQAVWYHEFVTLNWEVQGGPPAVLYLYNSKWARCLLFSHFKIVNPNGIKSSIHLECKVPMSMQKKINEFLDAQSPVHF